MKNRAAISPLAAEFCAPGCDPFVEPTLGSWTRDFRGLGGSPGPRTSGLAVLGWKRAWVRSAFPEKMKEFKGSMMSKFVRISLAVVLGFSLCGLAQTTPAQSTPASTPADNAAAATPNAPSASSAAAPRATGTKVGTINIEQAIFASNEGRRDFEQLNTKLEPKQKELKNANDEIESLRTQLKNTGDKLNEDAKSNLVKQIESKQKSFDRQRQDAVEEAQGQQGEIAQRILQKMAPVIVKYASENGFGVIIDTSQPWPQGPVVWYGQAVDITEPVVLAYNQVSGVPAPAGGGAAPKPAGSLKPASPATSKPAGTTKPATTTPPKQ